MVCFVLRPGPPPSGLKPPLINYTSTTTAATTPLDFVDNESPLSENVMYDEALTNEAENSDPAEDNQTSAVITTGNVSGVVITTTLIYDNGGTVNLYGKSSGSDRGKHRNTWTAVNYTAKTNYSKVCVSNIH